MLGENECRVKSFDQLPVEKKLGLLTSSEVPFGSPEPSKNSTSGTSLEMSAFELFSK